MKEHNFGCKCGNGVRGFCVFYDACETASVEWNQVRAQFYVAHALESKLNRVADELREVASAILDK